MKKILIICLMFMLVVFSIVFVACNSNSNQTDNIKRAEYVEKIIYREDGFRPINHSYIRFWYDEEWFPYSVHIDVYNEDGQFLKGFGYGYNKIYMQCLNDTGIPVPNTYMYLFVKDMKEVIINYSDYTWLTFKICIPSGRLHDDEHKECKVFANYRLKMKWEV